MGRCGTSYRVRMMSRSMYRGLPWDFPWDTMVRAIWDVTGNRRMSRLPPMNYVGHFVVFAVGHPVGRPVERYGKSCRMLFE